MTFSPPILQGEEVGYRRTFALANFFPLTPEDLEKRAAQAGFPRAFRRADGLYYGVSVEVSSEMENLSASLQFPATLHVRAYCAVATLLDRLDGVNEKETARINNAEVLTFEEPAEMGEATLSLTVDRPLAGHTYVLLYQPGA